MTIQIIAEAVIYLVVEILAKTNLGVAMVIEVNKICLPGRVKIWWILSIKVDINITNSVIFTEPIVLHLVAHLVVIRQSHVNKIEVTIECNVKCNVEVDEVNEGQKDLYL